MAHGTGHRIPPETDRAFLFTAITLIVFIILVRKYLKSKEE
jgi:hypothetical protein